MVCVCTGKNPWQFLSEKRNKNPVENTEQYRFVTYHGKLSGFLP